MQADYKEPSHLHPDGHEMLATLCEQELLFRSSRKRELLLQASKLRQKAYIQGITYEPDRNLNKQIINVLSEGKYILAGENVLINGATGCGKSYIACALGNHACEQGFQTTYFNMDKLVDVWQESKKDGTYHKLFKKLIHAKLLILDDFGLAPLDYNMKLALLQIIEDRYENHATILVAQLPVAKW